jgi:dienelactone hydrolase
VRFCLSLLLLAGASCAQDLASRYPDLEEADFGDPKEFARIEDEVNAYFDAEDDAVRAANLKTILARNLPFRVLEAVVRHGRRYGPVEATFVGNVQLPARYDPARKIPVLVGLNGATQGFEREASLRGFGVMMPWKIKGWVDPETSDRVREQLWEAAKGLNLDLDRVYATGCSVGGHATWIAGATRTDLWAALLPVSGSPGRILVAMSEVYLKNMKHLPVYATVGEDDDDILRMAREGQTKMKGFGNISTLEVVPKRGHESFDDHAEKLLAWCSELRRARYPAKLDFWGGQDLGTHHYWIEVAEDTTAPRDMVIDTPTGDFVRHLPVRPFHVTAEIKDQVVSLRTKEVSSLRVRLSPAMLDFAQEVTIRINGEVEWKGVPEASPTTLLSSSLARKDRLRTFAWEREFSLK